jgi:hypothetical protein
MRRFPLPPFRACITLAVLLAGCQPLFGPDQQTPPGPPAPPPAQQSLWFEIAGPSQIDTDGPVSWQAFAFGGSGEYQYRWEVTRQSGQQVTVTERKLSLLVTDNDGDIVLRLTVTSGGQTRVESFGVSNCISGCPN